MLLLQLRLYSSIHISGVSRNSRAYKPTKTTTTAKTTATTTAGETDSTIITPVPIDNSNTPLGPLLNFTINRRITLRPVARDVQSLHQTSTPTSAADLPLGESPAARAAPDRDTDNVVYVTAIGASSDQQAIAFVNMNAGFKSDQVSNEEIITKKANDNSNAGSLYEDDDLSTVTDITTSKIKH